MEKLQILALMGKLKYKGLGWFVLNHKEKYHYLIGIGKEEEIKAIYDREQIPQTFPQMAKEAEKYVSSIKK